MRLSITKFLMVLLILVLVFSLSACCGGKGDEVVYSLNSDERAQVDILYEEAVYYRDVVEELAKKADQSTVFDWSGNIGWENFMSDVDQGNSIFSDYLNKGSVFGYTLDEKDSECYAYGSACESFIAINLDLLSLGKVEPDCFPHEGIHVEYYDVGHSKVIEDYVDDNEQTISSLEFMGYVVDYYDSAYLTTYFYDLAMKGDIDYETTCNEAINGVIDLMSRSTWGVEEADSAFQGYMAPELCNPSERVFTNNEEFLDLFGITEEELDSVYEDAFFSGVVCEDLEASCLAQFQDELAVYS